MTPAKRLRRTACLCGLTTLLPATARVAPAQHQGFSFTAGADHCVVGHCVDVPAAWSDGHADSAVFVTPNRNPPGASDEFFDHHLTTAYRPPFLETRLYGVGGTDALIGASFNVLVVGVRPSCIWKHVSAAGSISGNVTFLDRASLNGNPGAFFLVQEIATAFPPASGKEVGIYYNSATNNRWGIFNQDQQAMVAGREFWIHDQTCYTGIHTGIFVNGCTPAAGGCYLDAPLINNRPDAVLLVTKRWSFTHPVYNDHPTGVYYDAGSGRWVIINEDHVFIPDDAEFNVGIVSTIHADDFETGNPFGWSVVFF